MSDRTPSWPKRCSDVAYDDVGLGEPAYLAEVGDLLWNPKGGDGHVIVAEVPCGYGPVVQNPWLDCGCGGWGLHPCPATTLVCECGEDSSCRDHHYELMTRHAS